MLTVNKQVPLVRLVTRFLNVATLERMRTVCTDSIPTHFNYILTGMYPIQRLITLEAPDVLTRFLDVQAILEFAVLTRVQHTLAIYFKMTSVWRNRVSNAFLSNFLSGLFMVESIQ